MKRASSGCWQRGGEFVPGDAVQLAACGFLANTATDAIPLAENFIVLLQLARKIGIGHPFAPLLEEKRDTGVLALVAERADPVRVHGAGVMAGFAAGDDGVASRNGP